jgi:hypothetical protein
LTGLYNGSDEGGWLEKVSTWDVAGRRIALRAGAQLFKSEIRAEMDATLTLNMIKYTRYGLHALSEVQI